MQTANSGVYEIGVVCRATRDRPGGHRSATKKAGGKWWRKHDRRLQRRLAEKAKAEMVQDFYDDLYGYQEDLLESFWEEAEWYEDEPEPEYYDWSEKVDWYEEDYIDDYCFEVTYADGYCDAERRYLPIINELRKEISELEEIIKELGHV